jgi:secondary thiamine-phosphate synthase enzyme
MPVMAPLRPLASYDASMKVTLSIPTERRLVFKPVTREIAGVVASSGVREGTCTVFCPHTTAGLLVNENADPDVAVDLVAAFEELVPRIAYRHREGNSPAHLLSCLTQPVLHLMVEEGGLRLGRWQGVFLCEFDGPRQRQLWVKVAAD